MKLKGTNKKTHSLISLVTLVKIVRKNCAKIIFGSGLHNLRGLKYF